MRRFVNALIEIDKARGGEIIKKFLPTYGEEAIIDIFDFPYSVEVDRFMRQIDARVLNPEIEFRRAIYGYTILDSLKAILHFNSYDYFKVYGWSVDRALFFSGVKYGRSPMVAIRAHPLKPSAVIYINPDKVDELAIKLATLEGIPIAETFLSIGEIKEKIRELF